MTEEDIKAKVLNLVRAQSPSRKRPIVTTEFSISSGNSRADLAILSNEFVGVEIKSKHDSLKRLRKQVLDYRNHFDRTILVLDGSHLVRYLRYDFPFVDLWTLDNHELRRIKEGTHERAPEQELYDLLTQQERQSAFRNADFDGLSKRDIFEHFFRKRYGELSKAFWASAKGRTILAEDLKRLSRFYQSRTEYERLAAERKKEWEDWLRAQNN